MKLLSLKMIQKFAKKHFIIPAHEPTTVRYNLIQVSQLIVAPAPEPIRHSSSSTRAFAIHSVNELFGNGVHPR